MVSTRNDEGPRGSGTYGWADAKQFPTKSVEVQRSGDATKINAVAASGASIELMEKDSANLTGTFTYRWSTKNATATVLSAEEFEAKIAAGDKPFEAPHANVPESCAGLFGDWRGRWSQGSFGELKLSVVNVDPSCKIKYHYGSYSADRPKHYYKFFTAEVKEGKVSFPCGGVGGTCEFRLSGDDLIGSYTNPSGGGNNGSFSRIR